MANFTQKTGEIWYERDPWFGTGPVPSGISQQLKSLVVNSAPRPLSSSIKTHSNNDRRRKALLGSARCTLTQRRPSCFKTLRLAEKLEMSKVLLSKISGQDLKPQVFEGKKDRYRPWHLFLGEVKSGKRAQLCKWNWWNKLNKWFHDDFCWICLSQKDFGGRVFGGMARNLSNGPQVLPAMVIRGESELQRRWNSVPRDRILTWHLHGLLPFHSKKIQVLQGMAFHPERGLPHDVGVEKGCWLEKGKDGVTSPCEGHAHRMKSLPLRFMVYHFNMAIRP